MKKNKTKSVFGAKIGNSIVTIDNGDGTESQIKLKHMPVQVCHDEDLGVASPWYAAQGNTIILGTVGKKEFQTYKRQDMMAIVRRMDDDETTSGIFSGHTFTK